MVWLITVGHLPCCVKAGENIWNVRTVPVGRRLAKWAVPLKVFLIAFCVEVFGVGAGAALLLILFSRSGCCVSRGADMTGPKFDLYLFL